MREIPAGLNELQSTRGEFAATACALAVREGVINVPRDVSDYFRTHPGELDGCGFCVCICVCFCAFLINCVADYARSGPHLLEWLHDALKAARKRTSGQSCCCCPGFSVCFFKELWVCFCRFARVCHVGSAPINMGFVGSIQ